MAGGRKANKGGTIVLRREEEGQAVHHGGAWKVAYADFVTAMMAFFLLMWLLNATTEEQRRGLADYFSPANIFSHNSSGSGQPFGGRSAYSRGAEVSDRGVVAPITGPEEPVPDAEEDDSDTPATPRIYHRDGTSDPSRADRDRGHAKPNAPLGKAEREAYGVQGSDGASAERTAQEHAAFAQASAAIRAAVAGDPGLAGLAHQLAVDSTPEGLRIQILDEERQPMFATGSADPNDRARLLLQKVTPILARLPEPISIAGYTDAAPYHGAGRSNWDLSLDRANATRRLLTESGLPEERIRSVTGNADRDPLLPNDPLAAANRRIAIVVLRQAQGAQAGHEIVPAATPAQPAAPVAAPAGN
jgi:chemotaxis protein MotB